MDFSFPFFSPPHSFLPLGPPVRFLSLPSPYSWLFWFVNRQPGLKVASQTAYEDSIKKVGGFASIESFWTIFTHLQPPSQLPPVTDILLFSSAVRPLWEEVPRGAKCVPALALALFLPPSDYLRPRRF